MKLSEGHGSVDAKGGSVVTAHEKKMDRDKSKTKDRDKNNLERDREKKSAIELCLSL